MAFFRSMLPAGLLLENALLAQNPPVAISVDVNANRHPINTNIYGVAYGDATALANLNSPLHRQGGKDMPGRGVYLYRIQAFNAAAKAVSAYSNQVQIRVK